MLLYPSGQMSDCFTNVNVICIMQTFEFINYIGQQKAGEYGISPVFLVVFAHVQKHSVTGKWSGDGDYTVLLVNCSAACPFGP